MDEAARKEISACLDIQPVKLDPGDTLPFNRPLLAWRSVELFAMEELPLWLEGDHVRAYMEAGSVSHQQWIRPGWQWPGGQEDEAFRFRTFMKAIRRSAPPPFPAGLGKTAQAPRDRWVHDEYRFPPYQDADRYLLTHPSQPSRLLDASEREILLGLCAGHTASMERALYCKVKLDGL